MTEANTTDTAEALRGDLRMAWHRYIDLLAPLRPPLYGYCRRLTGNVWDADDLVQDTLLRVFGQWGVTYPGVRNLSLSTSTNGNEFRQSPCRVPTARVPNWRANSLTLSGRGSSACSGTAR